MLILLALATLHAFAWAMAAFVTGARADERDFKPRPLRLRHEIGEPSHGAATTIRGGAE